jgi:hypothetical protein
MCLQESKVFVPLAYQTNSTMKKEFKIYKQGRTDAPVTILSNSSEPFDRTAKIAKYQTLGYVVTDMEGNVL